MSPLIIKSNDNKPILILHRFSVHCRLVQTSIIKLDLLFLKKCLQQRLCYVPIYCANDKRAKCSSHSTKTKKKEAARRGSGQL